MVKKIHFVVRPDGSTELKVEGSSGGECEKFTEPFEKEVGTIRHRERTDDYYRTSEGLLDEEHE